MNWIASLGSPECSVTGVVAELFFEDEVNWFVSPE